MKHKCTCGAAFSTSVERGLHIEEMNWKRDKDRRVNYPKRKRWSKEDDRHQALKEPKLAPVVSEREKDQHADQARWARIMGKPVPPKPVPKQARGNRFGRVILDVELETEESEIQRQRRLREQSRSGPVEIEEE